VAKVYFQKLEKLIIELDIEAEIGSDFEVKHFFSGAAFYANGILCASWSPVGLAFKLPGNESEDLIGLGIAKPLKYFEKGHIKQGYALFENPDRGPSNVWKYYFLRAVGQN